ncbi:hypothetical protein VA599_00415 [Chromobacterium sp. TRC.1.1.SA]|uniref:HTH cro/C1-type domain-containing protein n=1 Tax=Chromobacterium indicum TaxID=3110228 RepID=A0ABV0CDA9_9NEIS
MKVETIRLANLQKLISEKKTIRAVALAANTSATYLSQILNRTKSCTGNPRGLGSVLARKLEKGCNKPEGWMDQHHPEDNEGDEVVGNKQDLLDAFSRRVNLVCDRLGIPPAGRNRQELLGKRYGVSQKAARKWLVGAGFPETAISIKMATDARVSYTWLMTGSGNFDDSKSSALGCSLDLALHSYSIEEIAAHVKSRGLEDSIKLIRLLAS